VSGKVYTQLSDHYGLSVELNYNERVALNVDSEIEIGNKDETDKLI